MENKPKPFTQAEKRVLTEIYRRLNFFHNGNLNEDLLYLAFPSEAKKIAEFGLIKPFSKETNRALNWYSLTEKGKKFFSHYIAKKKISQKENFDLFTGVTVVMFDKKHLPT